MTLPEPRGDAGTLTTFGSATSCAVLSRLVSRWFRGWFCGRARYRVGFPRQAGQFQGREKSDIYVLMYLGSWWV